MKNRLNALVLTAGMALASLPGICKADDIFRGRRLPTTWQLDERVSYSVNEEDTQTTTDTVILKYSKGKKIGIFGFLNIPFKYASSKGNSGFGIGDIAIGFGPCGNLGNLYWQLYGVLVLPVGESEGKTKLGTGRIDKKIVSAFTYTTLDLRLEADGVFEYNFTGKKGSKKTPNEVYAGVGVGGEFAKNFRAIAGLTGLVNENGDFTLGPRGVIRYTISPKLHFELIGDVSLKSEKISKTKSAGLFLRYNF